MKKWDTLEYQRIVDAKLNAGDVEVLFANGDQIELAIQKLVPHYEMNSIPSLKIAEFEISVNGVEVPWDRIRMLSDIDFAREMSNRADKSARQVGQKLKALREAKKIKALDLANRAGIAAQTITRIEKGHTDVTFATLTKILTVMGYTLKDLARADLTAETQTLSYQAIVKKLLDAGLAAGVVSKIVPKATMQQIDNPKVPLPILLYEEITGYFNRVFGMNSENGIESENFEINDLPYELAYFKAPKHANINQLKAYSHYAYFLAKLVVASHNTKADLTYPGDIDEFKSLYYNYYEKLSLSNLLSFCWRLGIAILPLSDSGIFHGASWNIDGKHVIVLKQKSQSHAKWIFDLLHELYHVFVHLEEPNSSVLETEELDPFEEGLPLSELEANTFANQVILGENSDELAQEALVMASYHLENLKNAVQKVASSNHVDAAFLANYIAFRLQRQGRNWWAVANSFQTVKPAAFETAASILERNVSLQSLNPMDRNVLQSALEY